MGNNFRVTMWFKKGELDADLAEQAAAQDDDLHPGAVDLLPVEDRYNDDGSLTHDDSQRFGLRTGGTQCVPLIGDPVAGTTGDDASSDGVGPMVRELKRGRRRAFAAIGAMVIAAASLLIYAV